jgi:uncharacterized protein
MQITRLLPRHFSVRRTLALMMMLWLADRAALAQDAGATAAQAAQAAEQAGRYREASRQYQTAARETGGSPAVEYHLRAAEAVWSAGDAHETLALLDQLPTAALDTPQFQRAQVARAGAEAALGHVVDAIDARMSLDGHLNRFEQEANHDAIWSILQKFDAKHLAAATSGDHVTQGWLALARLAHSNASLSAYNEWREQYPQHPAESQLPALLVAPSAEEPATSATSLAAPSVASGAPVTAPATAGVRQSVGVLLPMTGPLAAASKALRAGMSAAAGNGGAILILDTAAGLDSALAQAALQGVSTLIGPLQKEQVTALAARAPALTTIALNYLDGERLPPPQFYPFGLAPEDEARAAASEAANAHLLRAVVLAAEGDWAQRTAVAFKAEFSSRGGVVVSEAHFPAGAVDFTSVLKRALGITWSDKSSKPAANPNSKVESLPVPRADIDVIFIAVKGAQARLLWPQIKFQRAGGIATYAPAAATDAGLQDLGGLRVCDAPWRIDTSGPLVTLRGQLAAANPRSADAQRLFALGYDAYTLARRANIETLVPGTEWAGLSGTLTLGADGSIHRRLSCTATVAPPTETTGADTP